MGNNQFERNKGIERRKMNGGFIIFFVILCIVPIIATFKHFLIPNKSFDTAGTIEYIQNADDIEITGKIDSPKDTAYIYINDEQIGYINKKGILNIKDNLYNNNKELCAHMESIDADKVNPEDFDAYNFLDAKENNIGYMQSAMDENDESVYYFYDENLNKTAVCTVEREIFGSNDEWYIVDNNGNELYKIHYNYNAVSKEISYYIHAYDKEKISVIQAMGIIYNTKYKIESHYNM